jgi:hypothetical protein
MPLNDLFQLGGLVVPAVLVVVVGLIMWFTD